MGSGTLYLGQSSKMSEHIRSKMLSVIENREFSIENSEAIGFHGRIIASVTVKMDGDISSSDRSDDELYYRLSANKLNVPALRERKEDLPLIAIQEMLKSSKRSGKELQGITNEFIERLSEYDFPGNIRELKNIIGEAVIRSRSNLLRIGDLPELFAAKTQGEGISAKTGQKKDNEAIKDGSRGLMAIFFADMVGYTTLMQKDEIEARNLIELMRTTMKPIIEDFGGKVLQYVGDETLCTFSSAIMAVTAAVKLQKFLKESKLLEIRIGIHIGDVVVKGDEIYGDGVNVASRIEPLAAPGEICISQDVYNHLRNQSNLRAESMGALNLKNVQFEVQVYKVIIE